MFDVIQYLDYFKFSGNYKKLLGRPINIRDVLGIVNILLTA